MRNQATGQAIKFAITMRMTISFESRPKMVGTDAPSTFLIPISFTRCKVLKVARPKRPRQAIKMANPENMVKS